MKKWLVASLFIIFLVILSGIIWFYMFKLSELRLTRLEQSNSVSHTVKVTTYLKQLSLKQGNEINYLVLGDSVAKSYDAKSGFFDSVAQYISQHTKKRVPIQNDAEDGMTSDQLLTLIQHGTLTKDIQRSNVISINIGGDDILKVSQSKSMFSAIKEFATVKSDYQTNLKGILSSIYTINPKAIVLVNDLYNVLPPQNKLFSTSEKLLVNWNLATYTSAEPYKNVVVVPVDQVLTPQKEKDWLTAQVHPNDLGHKWIANEIENELTKKRPL
jgi:lysophospholipase L1-like esterase